MNNQNKAVEEMAKIIANKMCYAFIDGRCSLDGSACDLICRSGDEYKECAKALYNTGYCKGGESEEVAVESKYLPPKDQEKERSIDEKIAKACKETAREILQEIDKELYEISKLYLETVLKDDKDYNSKNKYGVMQIAHEIVEKIARRKGVEVE